MGLSQKELADRIGLKEQQIQRYEATEYASASLTRIQEIIGALGWATALKTSRTVMPAALQRVEVERLRHGEPDVHKVAT